jgi:hypothetical protein
MSYREEFKPAALDHDDGDDDEMSGGESETSNFAGEAQDKNASASAHEDADQGSSNDNASEAARGGEDSVKSEPEVATPSQLSLSQMREKIAALEKVPVCVWFKGEVTLRSHTVSWLPRPPPSAPLPAPARRQSMALLS